MINKLVVDNLNITLNEQTVLPFTYTFSMSGVHDVRIGLDNTNEICAYAFKDCTDLSKVKHIPEKITMIKRNAFENCIKLKQFDMPAQIEYVGPNVFDGCTSLKEINFETNNPPRFFSFLDDRTNCYIPDGAKYVAIDKEDINEYYNNNKNAGFYVKKDNFEGLGFEEVDFESLDLTEDGPQYYVDNWITVHDHYNVIENRFKIKPTSIEFNDSGIQVTEFSRPLNPNETGNIDFDIKIYPENTTNSNIYLFTDKPNLMTVDQEGHYKAGSPKGKATVNVYACTEPYYDGTYCTAKLRFTINPPEVVEPAVDLTDEEFGFNINEIEYTSNATVLPILTNTYGLEINYTSSNTEVATIGKSSGNITIIGNGTTTISAEFAGNDEYNAKTVNYVLNVNIEESEEPEQPQEKQNLTNEQFGYNVSEITITSSEETLPTLNNTNSLEVSYNSSNTEVATVNNNGLITIVGNGTTTISAIFNGNNEFNSKTVNYELTVNIQEEQEQNSIDSTYSTDENGDINIINPNILDESNSIDSTYSTDENGDINIINSNNE